MKTKQLTRLSILMISTLLLLTGCEKKAQKSNADAGKKETIRDLVDQGAVPVMEDGVIPPNKPIWPEGTTFTRETKDNTIIARSATLDQIFRRAQERHGEELKGEFTFKFTVYPDGTIGPVQVTEAKWSMPAASALTDSMVQCVQEWLFPPGLTKPIVVIQPWRFE